MCKSAHLYVCMLCYLQKDLEELAKGCLSDISLPDFDLKTVEKFCGAYYTIMQDKQLA